MSDTGKNTTWDGRRMAWIFLAVFVVAMIPVIYIGRYDYPWSDDFSDSYRVYHAITKTGSFGQALSAAVEVVKYNYANWAGTYSAKFLQALVPGLLYDGGFWFKPLLMIVTLSAGLIMLLYVICARLLQIDRYLSMAFACLLCLVVIETMPGPRDAFYWFNGAVQYIFMLGIFLILISLLLYGYVSRAHLGIKTVAACACAIIVGGGNHITGMLMVLVLPVIAVLFFLYDRQRKHALISAGIVWLTGVLSYGVNALSPGSAERQSRYERMPLFWALLHSVQDAMEHFSIDPLLITALVVSVPMVWSALRRGHIKIRVPVLSLMGCLGFYIVMFFPGRFTGHGNVIRMLNVIAVVRVILLFLTEIILLGMLQGRLEKGGQNTDGDGAGLDVRTTGRVLVAGGILILLMMILSYSWMGSEQPMVTMSAVYSLKKGEAKQFDEEMRERYRIIRESEDTKIYLDPLTVEMYLIPGEDLIVVPGYWVNQAWCLYFEKEEIALKMPE